MDHVEVMNASEGDPNAFADIVFDRGWTDGFPVFLATQQKVQEILEHLGRAPEEAIGALQPSNRVATVLDVAINAALAGCLPAHASVVAAAIEAIQDARFDQFNAQCGVVGPPPLVIVSGPLVSRLEFNFAEGTLGGSGHRANGAVARAVRLILWNVGGGRPGADSATVFGHPARWGQVVCERPAGEGNPWVPHHVEDGLDANQSAVAVLDAIGRPFFTEWVRQGSDPRGHVSELVDAIGGRSAASMLVAGNGRGTRVLLLNPLTAQAFSDVGWSRRDLQREIFDQASVAVSEVERLIDAGVSEVLPQDDLTRTWRDNVVGRGAKARVNAYRDPSHIRIVVSGGARAGHVNFVFSGGGHSADGKGFVTKVVREMSG